MKPTLLLLIVLIAGCTSSPVWYASHPDKKVVTVDGYNINIVPRGVDKYDAWGGDEGSDTSTPLLKARQIRAVEMVSKCKVAAAELIPSSWILQTVVTCS